MVNVKAKLEEGWIQCRIVLEMMGKPKEHVEKAIVNVIEKIKGEKGMIVVNDHIADIKKKETGAEDEGMLKEMWATFAEVEILFKGMINITYFCFEYMPSSFEILEPQSLNSKAIELSEFFNDLQGKLHELSLVTKQLKSQNMFLQNNLQGLLNNFVMLLLAKRELSSEELARVTRVNKEALEDFLDKLIDEGKVEMIDEKYKAVLGGGKKSS